MRDQASLSDDELLAKLIEDYEPTQVPTCRVCDAALTIVAMGGGEPTKYACSQMQLGTGKPMDWEHYERSQWRDYRSGGDSRVMDLIERYKAAQGLLAGLTAAAAVTPGRDGVISTCGQPHAKREAMP